MKCRICGNLNDNQEYEVKEMMLGLREKFTYFQCSKCECLQIANIPSNMSKDYPKDYYSFSPDMQNSKSKLETFFKRSYLLAVFDETLFFVANDGQTGHELWKLQEVIEYKLYLPTITN